MAEIEQPIAVQCIQNLRTGLAVAKATNLKIIGIGDRRLFERMGKETGLGILDIQAKSVFECEGVEFVCLCESHCPGYDYMKEHLNGRKTPKNR